MTEPVDLILNGVEWTAIEGAHPDNFEHDELYATHEGVLKIGGLSLRCYTLNNGQRVFDADDFARLLGEQP